MSLTPDEWKMIAACVVAGLALWGWVIRADRSAEREFRDSLERREP